MNKNQKRRLIINRNKRKEIYFEKYKLMANYVFYQDNNYWIIFSIFMATNGLMLSSFGSNYPNLPTEGQNYFPFFGILTCFIWLIVCGRSIAFRNERIDRARKILNKLQIWKFKEKYLELWDNPKNEQLRYQGLSGRFSASTYSMFFIFFILAIWIILMLKITSIYFGVTIIIILLLIGIVDNRIRYDC